MGAILRVTVLLLAMTLLACPELLAQPGDAVAQATTAPAHEQVAIDPHPARAGTDATPRAPEDPRWAGSVLIIVLGLFLAAIVVGPIVRAEMGEQEPESLAHDDHGHH